MAPAYGEVNPKTLLVSQLLPRVRLSELRPKREGEPGDER